MGPDIAVRYGIGTDGEIRTLSPSKSKTTPQAVFQLTRTLWNEPEKKIIKKSPRISRSCR